MKTEIFYGFNISRTNVTEELISEFYKKISHPFRRNVLGFYSFSVRANDANISQVEGFFKEHPELTPLIEKRVEFETHELDQCRLLEIVLKRAPKVWISVKNGVIYKVNPKLKCLTPIEQVSNLYVKRSELSKGDEIFQTHSYEWVISKRIYSRFIAESIKGVEFRQLISTKREILDFYQIIPLAILPRFSKQSKGILWDRVCDKCQRDGYFVTLKEPAVLIYDHVNPPEVFNKSNFFATWEHFGENKNVEYNHKTFIVIELGRRAKFKMVIDQKVRKILDSFHIRSLTYKPVVVDGIPDMSKCKEGE